MSQSDSFHMSLDRALLKLGEAELDAGAATRLSAPQAPAPLATSPTATSPKSALQPGLA
jgi:hypothetical protein